MFNTPEPTNEILEDTTEGVRRIVLNDVRQAFKIEEDAPKPTPEDEREKIQVEIKGADSETRDAFADVFNAAKGRDFSECSGMIVSPELVEEHGAENVVAAINAPLHKERSREEIKWANGFSDEEMSRIENYMDSILSSE